MDDEANRRDEGDRTQSETDLPPEYCQYKDEGCDLAHSFLSCPFPQCIYERPRGRQRWRKQRRDREIFRLFARGEHGVRELAVIFGVSMRTVQRVLRNTPREGEQSEDE
jgi:hypothetical protein